MQGMCRGVQGCVRGVGCAEVCVQGVCAGGVCIGDVCVQGGGVFAGDGMGGVCSTPPPPPAEMATDAVGRHHTGMHSSY